MRRRVIVGGLLLLNQFDQGCGYERVLQRGIVNIDSAVDLDLDCATLGAKHVLDCRNGLERASEAYAVLENGRTFRLYSRYSFPNVLSIFSYS